MKTAKIACLALILVALTLGAGRAATYYVDATLGHDSNDGRSPAAAWRSLAKVNSATLGPGDQVLLKRGEIWRETLMPPASGSTAAPILFDAYGTGARPLLLGSAALGSVAAWSWESDHLWFAAGVSEEPEMVFHDGRGAARKSGKASLAADWDWWYDPVLQRVYVRLAENPGTHSVEAVQRNGVGFSQASDIRIANLEIAYARFGIALWGAADWVIDNVQVHDVTQCGIHGNNGSTRIRVQNCLITDWNWRGFGAQPGDGREKMGYGLQAIGNPTRFSDQWTVTGNTFRIVAMQSGEDTTAVNFDQQSHPALIADNVIVGGNRTGGGIMVWRPMGTAPIVIRGNWVQDSAHIALNLSEFDANQFTADVLVEGNTLVDSCLADGQDQEALRVWTATVSPVVVRGNLIRGTAPGSHRHDGIRVRDSHGVVLSNNTITRADEGILIEDSSGVFVHNCISAGNRGAALTLARTAPFAEDHNLLDGARNGFTPSGSTLAGDPQFVDPAGGDFRLRPASPAVDAGVDMGAGQLDLDGRGRPLGEGWDIGAYELPPDGLVLPPRNLRLIKDS